MLTSVQKSVVSDALTGAMEREPRFRQVEYAVRATLFERAVLFEEYRKKASFTCDNADQLLVIGSYRSRNVNVEIRLALLNGHVIAFYRTISELVDGAMVAYLIERWSKLVPHVGGVVHLDNPEHFYLCYEFCRDTKPPTR